MHVAAFNPLALKDEDVDREVGSMPQTAQFQVIPSHLRQQGNQHVPLLFHRCSQGCIRFLRGPAFASKEIEFPLCIEASLIEILVGLQLIEFLAYIVLAEALAELPHQGVLSHLAVRVGRRRIDSGKTVGSDHPPLSPGLANSCLGNADLLIG